MNCKIKKEIFSSPTGFGVYVAESNEAEIKIVGQLAGLEPNEVITVEGNWENTKYGRQFTVLAWSKALPTDRTSAVEFLASGLIPGVRRKTAEKIVAHLGDRAVELIYKHGEEVLEGIKGLGSKKEAIVQAVREKYEINTVVSQLTALGITPATAIRIYKKFGATAPEIVQRNPYALTEVDLIGFYKADEIARLVGIPEDSPYRARAGMLYLLSETLFTEGHTCIEIKKFFDKLQKIGLIYSKANREALEQLIAEDKIYIENSIVGLTKSLGIELAIAESIKRLSGILFYDQKAVKKYLEFLEAKNTSLTDMQKKAVLMALTNGFSVLTGGPGVGKTYTVRMVVEVFGSIYPNKSIALAAPTGRAAKRMEELIGYPAQTVHRLLGWRKQEIQSSEGIKEILAPEFNARNPLPYDLIIIDETSMLDIFMAKYLLDAIKPGTRVLFVGDTDQLPSVGPGSVLRDILASDIPRVHLTEIFRQAGESQIVLNSQRIRDGIKQLETGKDFFFIPASTPEETQFKVLEAVKKLSQEGEVQVLSPMKKGLCGTQELNKQLQEMLNPHSEGIQYGSKIFKVVDKVIQCRNDYYKGVMNGEVGIIKTVDLEEETLEVEFPQGTVQYDYDDLKNLDLAYAITVHKSQGSEYDYVIVPLLSEHYIMLNRSLLYTAVTRAKKGITIVGQYKALMMAISRENTQKRQTRLAEFLQEQGILASTI
ncbi:SF1B family DNA helicase RecD2 [Carboxydothermus ferrireducens]